MFIFESLTPCRGICKAQVEGVMKADFVYLSSNPSLGWMVIDTKRINTKTRA
jgi:hypothetical protein